MKSETESHTGAKKKKLEILIGGNPADWQKSDLWRRPPFWVRS